MSDASETPEALDTSATDTPQPTYVGVSVGVDTLIAAAPADARLGTQLVIEGDHLRAQYETLRRTTQALQWVDFDTTAGEAQIFVALWHQLRSQVYRAATRTVEHAQQFDAPRVVLAERSLAGPSLWERRTSEGLGAWLPDALQQAVAEEARAAGVPVVRVDADTARASCYACAERGRIDDGAVVCSTAACPVDRVARGRNTALRLARAGRVD